MTRLATRCARTMITIGILPRESLVKTGSPPLEKEAYGQALEAAEKKNRRAGGGTRESSDEVKPLSCAFGPGKRGNPRTGRSNDRVHSGAKR